ncbi:hypothetical protein EOL94_00080 [bacterium]|nr:hypothetical protein [bacterium]
MNKTTGKLYTFSLIFLSFLIIFGSIIYYFFNFKLVWQLITLILAISSSITFYKKIFKEKINNKYKEIEDKIDDKKKKRIKNLFFKNKYNIIFIFSLIVSLFYILLSRSGQALSSPWDFSQLNLFLFLFITILSLLILNVRKNKNKLLFTTLFLLLIFNIGTIIYKLGFGFDPFIHEASIKAIKKLGAIEPKNFYYIGQYVLILISNTLLKIPISFSSQFLIPILSAIFIPFSFLSFNKNKDNYIVLLTLLIIPFSIFTISTPQSLAYLFLILSIIFQTNFKKENIFLSTLLSFSALFIHPIAGLPALAINFLYILKKYKENLKSYLYKTLNIITIFLTAIILPVSFLFINDGKFSKFNFQNFNFINKINLANTENIFLNLNYFFNFNFNLFLLILIILSLMLWFRKYKKNYGFLSINILISLSIFISYILSQFISFEFLIDYEQNYYKTRLLTISIIILFPLLFLLIKDFYNKLKEKNQYIQKIFFLLISLLILSSIYNSFPRNDNYLNSHSFSISEKDVATINFIQEKSQKDYLVLANQQVSVAALKEFGFNRYLKNDIYFYPIPTSGPLYQYYLNMVHEKPEKKYIEEAMTLTGANEAYFVINKYWWGYKKIVEEAKMEANEYYSLFDNEIYVFKYIK